VHFVAGRQWHGFETVLRREVSLPCEGCDVGGRAVFETSADEMAMLYGATAVDNARTIAMPILRQGRWVRCGTTLSFARASVAHTIVVDPSVLRLGSVA